MGKGSKKSAPPADPKPVVTPLGDSPKEAAVQVRGAQPTVDPTAPGTALLGEEQRRQQQGLLG